MSTTEDNTAVTLTVAEIAEQVGGEAEGDTGRELTDVRALADAGPQHLSFLSNRKYFRQLGTSRAGAVLLDRKTDAQGHTAIRCDDPYAAFAVALALFHPQRWPEPGVDPRAAVADDAVVDGVAVEAFAWVGPGARVGPGSWIQAGAYVGAGARLGERCRLMPGSVVCDDCVLGDRVWLNPSAVIGGEGFGFAPTAEGNLKIAQIGRAVIGDDVEIGSNSCVDRGALADTVVERGVKADNLVQVGHGAEIGEHSLLVAYAGIAGSTKLGKRVVMAAKSGAINHLHLGDGVQVAVGGIAMGDHPAGSRLAGTPAIDHRKWLRATTAFADLPTLLKRVRALEKELAELKAGLDDGPGDESP